MHNYNFGPFLCVVMITLSLTPGRGTQADGFYYICPNKCICWTNIIKSTKCTVHKKGIVIPLQARCGLEGGLRYTSTLP